MINLDCTNVLMDENCNIKCAVLNGLNTSSSRVYYDKLKQLMLNKSININNIKLDNDKLIYSEKKLCKKDAVTITREIIQLIDDTKELSFKSNKNIEDIRYKAKLLGYCVNIIHDDLILIESRTQLILVSNKQLELVDTKYSEGLFEDTLFESIDFTDVDTSKMTNMQYMFCRCRAEHINLLNFDTSKVKDMQFMFFYCNIDELDLSKFNTSNVINMREMFHGLKCNKLDISNFDTSKVESMTRMFYKCNIIDINGLLDFNTSSVKSMRKMFSECTIRNIDLSSFDTSNVNDMIKMFCKCTSDYINLSSFVLRDDTNISNIFFDCVAKIEIKDVRLIDELNQEMSYE